MIAPAGVLYFNGEQVATMETVEQNKHVRTTYHGAVTLRHYDNGDVVVLVETGEVGWFTAGQFAAICGHDLNAVDAAELLRLLQEVIAIAEDKPTWEQREPLTIGGRAYTHCGRSVSWLIVVKVCGRYPAGFG